MAPSPPLPAPPHIEALLTKASQVRSLLTHFYSALAQPPSTATPLPTPASPSPLALLRDTSSLLRTHTTKLSLLLLNTPFTPSAILPILKTCESECLPAMLTAAELLGPQLYTSTVSTETRRCVETTFRAFGDLLNEIYLATMGEAGNQAYMKGTKGVEHRREGVLSTTGRVWGACDALIALEKNGLRSILVGRVEELRGVIKDALGELKEWGEDEEDELEAEDKVTGSDDEDEDTKSLDDAFGAANRLPKGRPDVKVALGETLRRIKLVDILFQALVKRRIKTFPFEGVVEEDKVQEVSGRARAVDELLNALSGIPDDIDDLAAALYDLDAEDANTRLDKICTKAQDAASKVSRPWDGGKGDEYTAWLEKWKQVITPMESADKTG
ncbi:hypothetical protein EJ06DRAFT_532136 [Trichodelitschia bisporula]|uniref:Cyclin-D1-binding protein 1-like N-terminal domain-containing protein n=1 Tax=Trichodelitschia bisporula TaxID=703511 RepID=A0A6G1HRB6_9PEZI|nr:hypothetical protein EJ06DRAFT_532136 [Trichodelitschia bisporula]